MDFFQCKISNDKINQYIVDFAAHFSQQCIFRALSLVDISEYKECYSEDIAIYLKDDVCDSKNRGYQYANLENNRIIKNIMNANKNNNINIQKELQQKYGTILVLFGNAIFMDLQIKYKHKYQNIQIGKFQFGRFTIKGNEILTLQCPNGLNIPDNSIFIFKSNTGLQFQQLNVCEKNLLLKHNICNSPFAEKVCNCIIFPSVQKNNQIYCEYGTIGTNDLQMIFEKC